MSPDDPASARTRPSGRALWALVVFIVLAGALQTWWRDGRQQDLGEALAAAVAPGDLQMLSSDTCPICDRARRWFQAHQIPFDECSIEREPACAARFSALMAPGTPVILVRGQAQLGFDPQRVLTSAQRGR